MQILSVVNVPSILFFLAMLIEQSEGWNRISIQPKFRRQFFVYQLPYSAVKNWLTCSCHNLRYLSSHFVVMTDQHAAVLDVFSNDFDVCSFDVINSTGTIRHTGK